MPRKKHEFHYIYKTTCIITKKFYIGIHSTSNLDDGYLGSGVKLTRSVKKYGKHNHVKEILEYLGDRESLIEKEKEIVNEGLINDPYCMNLVKGGSFSGLNYSKNHTEETKNRISLKLKGKSYEEIYGKEFSDLQREKRKEGVSLSHSKLNEEGKKERYYKSTLHFKNPSKETRDKMSKSQTGKKLSEETKNKISEGNKNKFVSEETRKKMSLAQQNMSEETRKKMSDSGKSRIKIKCLYCETVAHSSLISRWHNENCKNKN
jgi:hypothetical protein